MTRRDYVAIAAILKDQRERPRVTDAELATLSEVALELALTFKRDNRNFRAGAFFDAAGFPELTASRQGLN